MVLLYNNILYTMEDVRMKKISVFLMVMLCLAMFTGCGKKAKDEYDMDEFSEILSELTTAWADDFKYLTDDEKASQQSEIYNKYLKEYGLEVGQEITITGYYNSYPNTEIFFLRAKDDKNLEQPLTGAFKEDIKDLLKEDEVIRVKGELFTGGIILLDKCELISPDIDKRK